MYPNCKTPSPSIISEPASLLNHIIKNTTTTSFISTTTSDKTTMSTSIPLFFTLPPSNRHEIIILDLSNKITLKALNKQISATIKTSPNCVEFMAKHKSADAPA